MWKLPDSSVRRPPQGLSGVGVGISNSVGLNAAIECVLRREGFSVEMGSEVIPVLLGSEGAAETECVVAGTGGLGTISEANGVKYNDRV